MSNRPSRAVPRPPSQAGAIPESDLKKAFAVLKEVEGESGNVSEEERE
jgi:hypothetical protein